MKCPICGWEFGHTFEFDQVAETLIGGPHVRSAPAQAPALPAVPAGVTLKHKRPARAAGLRSDVAVPAIQALITGLPTGALAGCIAAALKAPHALAWAIGVGGGVAGVAWGILLHGHHNLLWEIETITGFDLDGDGEKGKPKEKESTPIEMHYPGDKQRGPQTFFFDLSAPPEKLRVFARGVLNGQPITELSWSGKGRLFSKPNFIQLRDELIYRKWVVWRNPEHHAQGCEPTSVGRWAFRQLARLEIEDE